jgi:hypothetical protein
MSTFKEEIVKITMWKKQTEKLINQIQDRILAIANEGGWSLSEAYKLEAKNDFHMYKNETRVRADITNIPMTEKDKFIYKTFAEMGFNVSFISVNLNPYPEFGQEGYSACFYMNLDWKS